ncbi:MAG: hypothetical protein CMG35_09255 [Candidatus Marinimicrobia bacterium]|nr:hypothetical protein [Candidatus Neomarinimicrobiota bacterium]MBO02817.1 hypothetical protein [Candidatus Neomarinimicrobiota bacterium]|tara:strand:- start:2118 stop:2369 length:252 start_codon:yes stop_codon:yes gene_type:complete
MKRRNNLHSFTLWPKASDIVSKIKQGRKSQFVSRAIVWFDSPKADRFRAHEELIERYREAQLQILELKKSQSFISKIRNKWSK